MTGAGAGIGRAIALAFAREGAQVAALDIDAARAREAASHPMGGGRIAAYPCDVSKRSDVFAAMREFVARTGASTSW